MISTKWKGTVVLAALSGLLMTPTQGSDLQRVMRQKLDRAQRILEAVVTSDWVALETQSRELERLTYEPAWTMLNAPEFGRYSAAFRQAIQDLHQAAAQRDLEKAPSAYVAVTLKCVECHRYLARARIAR